MLNPITRSLLLRRRPLPSSRLHPSFPPSSTSISSRRLLSTAPPARRHRSWKNVLLRWGIAGGIIYYYNTSSYFADAIHAEGDKAARFIQEKTAEKVAEGEEKGMAALDRLLPSNRARENGDEASPDGRIVNKNEASTKTQPSKPSSESAPSSDTSPAPTSVEGLSDLPPSSSSTTPDSPPEDDSDSQSGAFNPETGEINWDCPCLGGMAHGTCGDEFKEAFSCFVHSTEDPKGMDCIEKFKNMQDCFRKYPDEYPTEEEEEEVERELEDGGVVAKEGDDLRGEALPTAAKDKAEEGKKVQKAVASPSPEE